MTDHMRWAALLKVCPPAFFCLFLSRQKDIKNTFPVTCVTVKICNIAICPFVSPSVCPSDWGTRRLGGLPFPSSYSSSMELDTELTFVELGITRNKNRAYFVRFSISIRFDSVWFDFVDIFISSMLLLLLGSCSSFLVIAVVIVVVFRVIIIVIKAFYLANHLDLNLEAK